MARAPTPFERLIAQRAEPELLANYQCIAPGRPFTFSTWQANSLSHLLEWYLGPELSRDADEVRQIVQCDSRYVGSMMVVLRIRLGAPVPGLGEGYCELGTIMSSEEYYDFGADLAALREAGVTLSWEAAQWVHAAGRDQLFERRARGEVPGGLTARKIRLNLFHRPTPEAPHANAGIQPPAFAFESSSRDGDAATALVALARAIVGITHHSDPTTDRLLRDPSSHDVLRDLLLERGGPVEALLGDAAKIEVDWLPLPEADIDGELVDLWNKVLELDPMIDTSDPAVFDLPGPALED